MRVENGEWKILRQAQDEDLAIIRAGPHLEYSPRNDKIDCRFSHPELDSGSRPKYSL
ncbi:MAG: hypothetical protein ACMG6E_00820 [Candidatus Roizmanbacteria bacterium]